MVWYQYVAHVPLNLAPPMHRVVRFAYITFERQYGSTASLREAYLSALIAVKDYPISIAMVCMYVCMYVCMTYNHHDSKDFLQFEREDGSIDDVINATKIVNAVSSQASALQVHFCHFTPFDSIDAIVDVIILFLRRSHF